MPAIRSLLNHVVWLFRGVQVCALGGGRGTGKSFRAQLVAQKHGIDLFVDDGLLIRGGRIVGGRSAKKEKGVLAAIGTALFADETHAASVRAELAKQSFKRILLIGTSEKMVRKIAKRLQLPHPSKFIHIEDVATREEIAAAIHSRTAAGALPQVVLHCVQEFDSSLRVEKVIVRREPHDYAMEVMLAVPYKGQTAAPLYQLQEYMAKHVESFSGIIMKEVNINVGRVSKGP